MNIFHRFHTSERAATKIPETGTTTQAPRERVSRFEELPPELHLLISQQLTYPDALSLKHTNRYFYYLVDTGLKLKVDWLIERRSLHLECPNDRCCDLGSDLKFCRGSVRLLMQRRREHFECESRPGLGCLVYGTKSCAHRQQPGFWMKRCLRSRLTIELCILQDIDPTPRSMATTRDWLDTVYLAYFLIHIPILLCVDLVPLYPASLWVPPSSPLHLLYDLRVYYIETYNDQFFAPPPAAIPSFFSLFAFLELIFHLPVSLWAVRALLGNRGGSSCKQNGLNGSTELLLLVYGIETALTTATCMYEALLWDPVVVTWQQKLVLLGGLYGGYLAVAILLTVDMYTRLLRRLDMADAMKKVE
ncbi:hypothetical protein AAE478_001420 [Parahypoxylon ruwenzoriense]